MVCYFFSKDKRYYWLAYHNTGFLSGMARDLVLDPKWPILDAKERKYQSPFEKAKLLCVKYVCERPFLKKDFDIKVAQGRQSIAEEKKRRIEEEQKKKASTYGDKEDKRLAEALYRKNNSTFFFFSLFRFFI